MRKILVTGGARSGKSNFSLSISESIGEKRLFLATAQANDREMEERIERHQQERKGRFDTEEEPVFIEEVLKRNSSEYDVVLIDCITVWLGNLFLHYEQDKEMIHKHIERLAFTVETLDASIVIVTNELGNGIVPQNQLSRIYRDTAGSANQMLAKVSNEVYMCVCGIPSQIK